MSSPFRFVATPRARAKALIFLAHRSQPYHRFAPKRVVKYSTSEGRLVSAWVLLAPLGPKGVSLHHVDQVEQRAADAANRWNAVRRLLEGHRAGSDFAQAVINRSGLCHVREWDVNRDCAVRAQCCVAICSGERRCAGIGERHSAADRLRSVLAGKTLQRAAVERLRIDHEILSAIRIGRGWNEPLG